MVRRATQYVLTLALLADAGGVMAKTPGEALADSVVVNGQVFSVATDPYPAHSVSFPGEVTGLPDLIYQIQPGYRPNRLDLYLPPKTFQGPRPVIVFIHGGGWMGGGNRFSGAFDNWPDVLAAMARRGYVVAAVTYRFSGEAPSPAAPQDVKAAIRWLRANAAKFEDGGWFPLAFGTIIYVLMMTWKAGRTQDSNDMHLPETVWFQHCQ